MREPWNTYRAVVIAVGAFTLAGAYVSGQHVSREKRLLLQQTTMEVASALSSQVKGDLEHLVRGLSETGESKLKPLYLELLKTEAAKKDQPKDQVKEEEKSADFTSEFEFDRDFLDVSIWTRADANARPKRMFLALNHPYISPSQNTVLRSPSTESAEAELISGAFRGSVVVSLAPTVDTGSVVLLAIPLSQGTGEGNEVVAAHIRLHRFQRAFKWEGSIRAVLVNSDGFVIAHTGYKLQDIRESLGNHPLVQAMRSDTNLDTVRGQMDYTDSKGTPHIGGYRRINPGRLAVIASVPESEVLGTLSFFGGSIALVALLFGCAVGVGFVLSSPPKIRVRSDDPAYERLSEQTGFFRRLPRAFLRFGRRAVRAVAPTESEPEPVSSPEIGPGPELGLETRKVEQAEPTIAGTVRRRVVTVLHGSLSQLHQILQSHGTEVTVEAIKEAFSMIEARVRDHGGKFAREQGSTFIAAWGAGENPGDGDFHAVRCAMDLRADLSNLNQARRTDGEKPLSLAMGIDSGLAIAGAMEADGGFGVIGEVLVGARRLDQLAASSGHDLFVAEEVWNPIYSRFVGERVGQAPYRNDTKERAYFEVRGFVDDKGSQVIVVPWKLEPAEISKTDKTGITDPAVLRPPVHQPDRWNVNNGTHVAGPWTSEEIGRRLFAQELDFDCECWKEGGGTPTPIAKSGIFKGSDTEGADLWVFDGNTVHGPFTEGFLKTAIQRKAIGLDTQICEKSTILGWRAIQLWIQSTSKQEVDSEPLSAPVVQPQPPADVQVAQPVAAESTEAPPLVETSGALPQPMAPLEEIKRTPLQDESIPASAPANEYGAASASESDSDSEEIPPEDPESWRRAA